MDILDEEILRLWSLLNKHRLLYLMVGGFATTLYGFNRTTQDLDIWIKDSKENPMGLRQTLKELEIGDLRVLKQQSLFQAIVLSD